MFGLLGRNGAGKSTLMRIWPLQERMRGRSISRDLAGSGQVIDVIRQKRGARDARVPSPVVRLSPASAGGAVTGSLCRPEGRSTRVEARGGRGAAAGTNLWDVRNQRVGTFSGGMRQRLGRGHRAAGESQADRRRRADGGARPRVERGVFELLSADRGSGAGILSTPSSKTSRSCAATWRSSTAVRSSSLARRRA